MDPSPYQVMPSLSAEEYEALKADIAARGVQVPVEYDDRGNILDGHHRVQICEELGIVHWPKQVRQGLSEFEKRHHARRLNLERRHLDRDARRTLIAQELRERPDASDRAIADGLKVDHKTVGSVREDMESGGEIPHLDERRGADGKTYPASPPEHEPHEDAPAPIPFGAARAIMGSRQEPADSDDYFPTPPFAVRALIVHVFPAIGLSADDLGTVWEPHCGEGHMAAVLCEYSPRVLATNLKDYGYGQPDIDFLDPGFAFEPDWIVMNPPFKPAARHVRHALGIARKGVAAFVRLQWLEGVDRYNTLFSVMPPTLLCPFAERVPLCKGKWDPEGSTATAYVWLVWQQNAGREATRTRTFWIQPGCRVSLAKPDDVARFTQTPVNAGRPLWFVDGDLVDPVTGEIIEPIPPSVPSQDEVPAPQRDSPDANLPDTTIPDFLRRTA
jgi:hypothetical protein